MNILLYKYHTNIIVVSIKTEEQVVNTHYTNELMYMHTLVSTTSLACERGRFANPNAKLVYENMTYKNEYLKNSWGNSMRLDYGTGHELNYFCYCYHEYVQDRLHINEVSLLLVKYFRTAKLFINKFNMEPIGSTCYFNL
jgi:serine/threonine-protein phosphatase 2A activator